MDRKRGSQLGGAFVIAVLTNFSMPNYVVPQVQVEEPIPFWIYRQTPILVKTKDHDESYVYAPHLSSYSVVEVLWLL
jgi:hypothetical protein